MSPFLRKAHRYAWFSLALLLPLGWLAAIWVIPDDVIQTPAGQVQPDALPLVLHSREAGDFVINVRSDSSDTKRQIEILIKKPLGNPNTTLVAESNGSASTLGLLGTRGIRRFDLNSLTSHARPLRLQFIDHLQGRTLRTVVFE